jgi:hypothetical protein
MLEKAVAKSAPVGWVDKGAVARTNPMKLSRTRSWSSGGVCQSERR